MCDGMGSDDPGATEIESTCSKVGPTCDGMGLEDPGASGPTCDGMGLDDRNRSEESNESRAKR
jgi:hypothetical protein